MPIDTICISLFSRHLQLYVFRDYYAIILCFVYLISLESHVGGHQHTHLNSAIHIILVKITNVRTTIDTAFVSTFSCPSFIYTVYYYFFPYYLSQF